MTDQSELDRKYFIDGDTYNCPFCNRHSVVYSIHDTFSFDWSESKKAHGYIVLCHGCKGKSLHLSYFPLDNQRFTYTFETTDTEGKLLRHKPDEKDLDKYFFYSHPTSFFTLDERIPRIIRNLIAEADGCRKMNHIVGASGALRKAIYKFLKEQKANNQKDKKGKPLPYKKQIKWVKGNYPQIPKELFSALSNIQDMTSEELHEDKDWEPWSRDGFDFIVATVKALMDEIYVTPENRKKTLEQILLLKLPKETTPEAA